MIHRARILGRWEPLAVDQPPVRRTLKIARITAYLRRYGFTGAAVAGFGVAAWSQISRLAGCSESVGIRTGELVCVEMAGAQRLPDESRRKDAGLETGKMAERKSA